MINDHFEFVTRNTYVVCIVSINIGIYLLINYNIHKENHFNAVLPCPLSTQKTKH